MDPLGLHKLDEAQVGHDGDDRSIAVQTTLFLHVHGQQGDDLVAVDLLTLLVAGEAAVRVAVKGDAAVKAALDDSLFQIVQMGAAHTGVDVLSVRLHADKGTLCAQTGEQLPGYCCRGTVGAVDADVQAGQVAVDGLIQVVGVILDAVGAVGHAAHIVAGGQLEARALIVDIGFNFVLHLVRQLVAGAGENFDAVEFHRVVRRRDDHAGVGVVLAHQIGHGGSGDDAQTLNVRAHAAQTGGQGSFQHITGLAGVLADEDTGLVASAAGQHGGSAASDEHRHLTGQVCTSHAAHTVGTKILSHSKYLT